MATVFALNLVLIQYDMGRTISLWTTIVIIALVYLYDFAFYSSAKQKEVFYAPMLVESVLLLFGWLLYFFRVPERFFPETKWVQMYLTGYLFFTIFFINFLFETNVILFKTIKLNSGYYDENLDNWWHMDNVYRKE